MAQTLALYRGQITAASGTRTTIFTNSASGTATRLRIGSISFYNSTGNMALTVEVLQSGSTYSSLIGAFKGASIIQSTLQPLSDYKFNLQGSVGGYFTQFNWSQDNIGSLQPVSANTLSPGGYFIQDTIIGPSDAIIIGWYSSSGSGTISYLFSTITES
jgi:hypothetical protein